MKKKLMAVILGVSVLSMTACSVTVNDKTVSVGGSKQSEVVSEEKADSNTEISVSDKKETSGKVKNVEDIKTDVESSVEDKPEPVERETKEEFETEAVAETESDVDDEKTDIKAGNGSIDFDNLSFVLDGDSYDMKNGIKPSDFTGWAIDEYYDKDDLFVENNEYTIGESYVNPKYEDVELKLGCYNNTDDKLALEDCNVRRISYSVFYGFTLCDDYAIMTFNGVSIGDSIDDVVAMCGEPDSIYEASNGKYVTYTYDADDYSAGVDIDIFTDFGVGAIDITWHSYDR